MIIMSPILASMCARQVKPPLSNTSGLSDQGAPKQLAEDDVERSVCIEAWKGQGESYKYYIIIMIILVYLQECCLCTYLTLCKQH